MSTQGDFSIIKYEDGLLAVSLAPPTAIGGWSLEFRLQKRFGPGVTPLALRSCASGFINVSGMTITDSGMGRMLINFWGPDTSGLDSGNYAYTVNRTDSGYRTGLADGYTVLGPSM